VSPTDVKRMAKKKIDVLSPASAKAALDFMEFLDTKEEDEATLELLAIPGFLAGLREAEREVADGKVMEFTEVQRRRRNGVSRRAI
jgi:hypothetical protein